MYAGLMLSEMSGLWRWLCIGLLLIPGSIPVSGQEMKSGSGFLFHPEGYILTNNHVVAGSTEQFVVLSNGNRVPAKLVATDPKKDLALLKIPGSNYPTLPIGESAKMSVMDSVLAMGYPMYSTIGYDVSAYDGKINAIRQTDHAPMLQIDANINPGNSGGPLLNDRGEVIGVVVAKINAMQLAKTMGAIPERINFAIPVDEAKSMILMAYPAGFTPSNRTVSLRDQQIFAQSKDATVLILAPKDARAQDQPLARAQTSPDKSLPLPDGPSPDVFAGEGTQPVSMKPTLQAFVEAFIQSGGSDQMDSVMQFYAPKVNYYEKGVVDAAFIRRDISELRRRWPRREYQLLTKPVARAGPRPNQYLISYRIGYTLTDRRSEARGISNITILVQDDDGTYSVLSLREINEKNGFPGQ